MNIQYLFIINFSLVVQLSKMNPQVYHVLCLCINIVQAYAFLGQHFVDFIKFNWQQKIYHCNKIFLKEFRL